MIRKAVPVVTRRGGTEILAFEHPMAGKQLVKGTIEAGESAIDAAARELFEESGLRLDDFAFVAASQDIVQGQEWVFFHHAAKGLPDRWVHHCLDDGGHDFRFFWHPLSLKSEGWHPVLLRVLRNLSAWLSQGA